MSCSVKAYFDPELNIEVVQLDYTDSNPEKSLTARVAPALGSNLYGLSYGPNDLIVCDKPKLANREWTGTFILWPLPNRVSGKEYTFAGKSVSLAEIKRREGTGHSFMGWLMTKRGSMTRRRPLLRRQL